MTQGETVRVAAEEMVEAAWEAFYGFRRPGPRTRMQAALDAALAAAPSSTTSPELDSLLAELATIFGPAPQRKGETRTACMLAHIGAWLAEREAPSSTPEGDVPDRFRVIVRTNGAGGWEAEVYDLADHGPDLPYAQVTGPNLVGVLDQALHYVLMAEDPPPFSSERPPSPPVRFIVAAPPVPVSEGGHLAGIPEAYHHLVPDRVWADVWIDDDTGSEHIELTEDEPHTGGYSDSYSVEYVPAVSSTEGEAVTLARQTASNMKAHYEEALSNRDRALDTIRADRDRMAAALRVIAGQEPAKNALHPQWGATHIALAALDAGEGR